MTEPLLAVEDLQTYYPITSGLLRRQTGQVKAVDGVSFDIDRGEALGLVGESGSGKTTVAHTVLRLEEATGGTVRFDGDPVSELSGADLRAFRRRAQLVVQDPGEAFSPRMTVGDAVAEPLEIHGLTDDERQQAIVADILERVGLSAEDAERYPHEFSGGEKQRIALARALVVNPDLIVADEPTSTLDGRTKSDVLALLAEIKREFDVSILFISHDIDVVRRFCDRIAVMYLGEIVERGRTDDVLSAPAHPYTRVLLDSVPSLDPTDRERPRPLTDTVPDPSDPPSGCRFHTRCPELIPPDGVAIEGDDWRAIAAFRFSVQTGDLPGKVDPDDAPLDASTVRSAFDLPETIPDETVETGVEDAVSALASGDRAAAVEAITEAVPTVCEHETPAAVETDGRLVRCHRYDESMAADPLSGDD